MNRNSNILIVESKNDRAFFSALVKYLNLRNITFQEPICNIGDYECMEGLNVTKLKSALLSLKYRLPKEDIKAIGIVLDHDGKQQERFNLINAAIKEVFATDEHIETVGQFITISLSIDVNDVRNLKLACFLTNVNQKGELETLLKEIKSKEAIYADCLEAWRNCLLEKNKTISDKDFDKFWISNYVRFDTCSKKEKKRAGTKCSMSNFDYIMETKAHIWDFEHEALTELKAFLNLFKAEET